MGEYEQQPVDPEVEETEVPEEEGEKYDGGPIPRTDTSDEEEN
jgi:hypothetical protein